MGKDLTIQDKRGNPTLFPIYNCNKSCIISLKAKQINSISFHSYAIFFLSWSCLFYRTSTPDQMLNSSVLLNTRCVITKYTLFLPVSETMNKQHSGEINNSYLTLLTRIARAVWVGKTAEWIASGYESSIAWLRPLLNAITEGYG